MDRANLVLLTMLESDIANAVVPAIADGAVRRTASLAGRVISKRIVEVTIFPDLQATAVRSLAGLLPELRARLSANDIAGLEQALERPEACRWPELDRLVQQAVSRLLAKGETAANRLAGQVIGIDARLRTQQQAAFWKRCDVAVAEPAEWDPSTFSTQQQTALLGFLRAAFPDDKDLAIVSAQALAGGFSKQTVVVELAGAVGLPTRIVVRRDAPFKTSGGSVVIEFPVLQRMHAAGVPVAEPIALEASGEVLGTPFLVSSHVPGGNIGDSVNVQRNPEVGADLARSLARLHGTPIAELETLLAGGEIPVRDRVLAELVADAESWAGLTHVHAYTMQAALDWLQHNVELADGPKVVVHRDIGMHNILVDANSISAILDWETVAIGVRAEDLGMVYRTIDQLWDWESFIAAYEQAAGLKLDRRQLDYYVIAGLVRMAALVARLGDKVLDGEIKSVSLMYVGDCLKDHIIGVISRKLAEILSAD